jgi:hypothetical protein
MMVTSTTTSPSRRNSRRTTVVVAGTAQTDALTAARAEALFASDVSSACTPDRDECGAAIRRALLRHGGVRGCAAQVAAQYGDYPETAAPRMRWARQVVCSVYGTASEHRNRRPADLLRAASRNQGRAASAR